MDKEVLKFIKRHSLLHRNATVLVGVSGGPDSMALLHFLYTIKEEYNLRLVALSIDHGLRGNESKEDVRYVEKVCNKWKIEFIETFLDVQSYKDKERKGTQLAARELRYQFFKEKMEAYQADYLALGHHGDDQVETILMKVIRGANPQGVTGITVKRPFSNGFLVRPLLCVSKQIIEEYCSENEIDPRRDPSNKETIYTRNYFRIHILPLLKRQNPSLHKTFQRLSEAALHDQRYLEEQARQLIDEIVHFNDEKGEVSFEWIRFVEYPFALQRRSFHLILNYLYDEVPDDLYYVHEDLFFDLIHNEKANVSVDMPKNLKMVKAYQTILFYFEDQSNQTSYRNWLQIPGKVVLPDGASIIASITDNPEEDSKFVMSLPFNDNIKPPLIVRSRQAGDKLKVRGLNGSKKVKDIFIDEKIPRQLRDSWPLVVDQEGNILWLVGIRKGYSSNNSKSRDYLRLQYVKAT
ncbi:tRNA lysidine(34) synthetase TilS [Aquibacillus albus]|uniref:tRNA(Ile)-lysidine synthase n=1 Tax=Aquibacillus albus TaxID=1168171 RepID=A0ABS2N4U4_9BACI|nr:tRNA lysidine(34) synthetase TilS [Aquibacillus albus]MBM7573170.1 tRNA(Ile)-lysidine synthase [Aquibacillus albus]